MSPFGESSPRRAGVLFGFGVGCAVLASPLRLVWAASVSPWWSPLLVWAAVIGIGGAIATRWGHGGRH